MAAFFGNLWQKRVSQKGINLQTEHIFFGVILARFSVVLLASYKTPAFWELFAKRGIFESISLEY